MTDIEGPTGETSPDGQRHPGEIRHEDEADGRAWTRAAGEVPQTVAWAESEDGWMAVVRVVMTGAAGRREILRFGRDGEVLDVTAAASPTPPPTPAPTPTPTPSRTPTADDEP